MFQYYDTILEGDIIPVQHKGDLLYYTYLSCSNASGVTVPWDAGDITHVEWYIGARLIDRYPLNMPHVAKTYSELTETRLFRPLRFSYPIPIVCLQYEKMYLKVIGAPKASLRYTCHMVYMNMTPEERMKIATEPYSMHIEQHHEVNPDQLYIHAPIKYFITSEFQYTNVDSIELVVNGQRTSGPILPEYFSPYIIPSQLRAISYPTPQTIVNASSISREQVEPLSTIWISKRNIRTNYNIVTSASSNSTFAYTATGPTGWISDPAQFGEETVYTVTASLNPTDAYKSTMLEGWTSDAVFGNTVNRSANTIVGSNVDSRANLLSATSYWLASTTYTADATGQYNVFTSTGTLSAANQWTSSNTFGTRIPDGEYSIVPSDAWPVLDENATTFWANTQFGQMLYTQSITGNNASSNLSPDLVPAKLFDALSQSGWVSNSAANVYGYGSNAGVYASVAWRAFDRDDTTSWTGGNEFQAQQATIPNARMNAFSNVSNAWLASDYNDATAWISNTLEYGHTLPTTLLTPVTPSGDLYGRTANIVTPLTATSNAANVANALAWTNTVSWTSNASFGQVTVPQGTYTYTPAPTTVYSNETVAAVTSFSAGYTGFSAYTNSSVYFVTNPIPGVYGTNVLDAYNTTRTSEATIATILPSGEATKSRSNIAGSSLVLIDNRNVGTNTGRIFNKFPNGTFTDQPTRTLLSGTTYIWSGVFNASNGIPVSPTTPTLTIQGPVGTGNVAYTVTGGINGTWQRSSDFTSNVFTLSTSSRGTYDTASVTVSVSPTPMRIQSTRGTQNVGTLTSQQGRFISVQGGDSVELIYLTGDTINATQFTQNPTLAITSVNRDFYKSATASDAPNYTFEPRYTQELNILSEYNSPKSFRNSVTILKIDNISAYYLRDYGYVDLNPPDNAIRIGLHIVIGFYTNIPPTLTNGNLDKYRPIIRVTGNTSEIAYGDASLIVGKKYFFDSDTGDFPRHYEFFLFNNILHVRGLNFERYNDIYAGNGSGQSSMQNDPYFTNWETAPPVEVITLSVSNGIVTIGRPFGLQIQYSINTKGDLIPIFSADLVGGFPVSLLKLDTTIGAVDIYMKYVSGKSYEINGFVYDFSSGSGIEQGVVDNTGEFYFTLKNACRRYDPRIIGPGAAPLLDVLCYNVKSGESTAQVIYIYYDTTQGFYYLFDISPKGLFLANYGFFGPISITFRSSSNPLPSITAIPTDINIPSLGKIGFQLIGNRLSVFTRVDSGIYISRRLVYSPTGGTNSNSVLRLLTSTPFQLMDYAFDAYLILTLSDANNNRRYTMYIMKDVYYTDESFAMPGFVPYSLAITKPFGYTRVIMDRTTSNVYAQRTIIQSVTLKDRQSVDYEIFYYNSTGQLFGSGVRNQNSGSSHEIPSHPSHIIVTVFGADQSIENTDSLVIRWSCDSPNPSRNLIGIGVIQPGTTISSVMSSFTVRINQYNSVNILDFTDFSGSYTLHSINIPVQTESIIIRNGNIDVDITRNPLYDFSRITLRITNVPTGSTLEYVNNQTIVYKRFINGQPYDLIIRLSGPTMPQHIKKIRFTVSDVMYPAQPEIYLGGTGPIFKNNVSGDVDNPGSGQSMTWTRRNTYFTEDEFRFRYTATTSSDINFTLDKIDFLDERDGVIGTLRSDRTSIQISPGFRTSIPNIGVTASLNTSATSDQYRIEFDGNGDPIRVINTTQGSRLESLELNGRFANVTAAYTIFSNVAVSTVTPGRIVGGTSQPHNNPPNSFLTVCSLDTIGWVPSGQLACSYTLAPYSDTTISLTFPRAVTVGRVDINSSYGPKFQISNGPTNIGATSVGNTYTFTTTQTISALHIRPNLSTSAVPLTLSNIIVYDDIGCRISPSIPGTTLTMYSGGVRLATTDGNVYTGYSFEPSDIGLRPLTNFIGSTKTVTFTANVHQNALGLNASIPGIPITVTRGTVSALSVNGATGTVPSLGAIKEYTLSFTVTNWDGTQPRIGSNVLVANVFAGGRNQANAFITLATSQVYGGVVSSNLGSLYTVFARNTDVAAWAPAVIGTSYSRYSYTLTQSNVYQPSVYFKLIRPSGVELHKDFVGAGDTTVGLAPIGEYTLTPVTAAGLFTMEGLATPLTTTSTTTVTLAFPRPVTVTRILVSGTSVIINNGFYAAGETLLATSITSATFTFTSLTNITRILLFNARGLITPRLVGATPTPTGNYWVSNTLSSNVLVTPPVFGWSFPLANVTGYTITSSQRLPYKLNVSSGTTVLDRWVNVNAQSYTAIFPAPRQLTSLGCNVLELVDTTTIDCSLRLIVYSSTFTPLSTPTTSVTISSNIYGPPVFCTVSGLSVPPGSRTVISNLQPGTDTATFDFGSNVVNISNITYSTLTTMTTTPGLLRVLGSSVSVVGRIDVSSSGATYQGVMSHPMVANKTWNNVEWNSPFTFQQNAQTSLELGNQIDLYPFSTVGIQLGGTLRYEVISSLTYTAGGHLYAYRLNDVGVQAIQNAFGKTTAADGSWSGGGVTYSRIDINFPDAISQIQVYGITVTATSLKTNWNIWCRPTQSGQPFSIVTIEGGTTNPSITAQSVVNVGLPTQPPFSNIFGVRMTRTGPCHFSNITLYNDLGAAVNTNDVRGRGLESFSFTPQSSVQFKSYSFISDPPITSWTLKHGSATIDSVLVNSNVSVYRELSGPVTSEAAAITLEISNAVSRAQISDFKLYSEAYQMVTSNATAPVMYGSALAGRYAIYTSSSPTYQVNPMPFQTGFYTRVNGSLIQGPWIQIEMPIPIVVSKCFFYGNHRQYTLLQSSDGGASWTIVCSGDADVYREIPQPRPSAQFFRFVCQSIYGTSWNVDIALCNSLGERLNSRYASGYITYPEYFGGLSRGTPTPIQYTVPSPLSNIYFRGTNVSNVIIGGRTTTMTVVSDGFRQFTPSTPIPPGPTNIVIDGIDNGTTATWTDIELLDATHRPMIHRGNVMVSTIPQGYYEFSGNRITFPVPVTPVYSNVSGTLTNPTSTRQYTLQNTNEILYDADFKRLTPLVRSNGFVRDIVYSGSNLVAQRQFIYFDAGSSRGANSYTFTCDPPPIRWTLQCDGVTVHSQTTPNWSTDTTYTSLIQNGCTGQTFTLSIDAIQSTTSNTLRISSFGVYNDRGLLLTPQFTSNTVTASRFYDSTQAKGYFEVTPESETNFVFNGASSSHSGDIIVRLPCFVRIDRCTLTSGSATFSVSADGSSSWVTPSRATMALYIKIQRTSITSMQGLSVFINSTQCII